MFCHNKSSAPQSCQASFRSENTLKGSAAFNGYYKELLRNSRYTWSPLSAHFAIQQCRDQCTDLYDDRSWHYINGNHLIHLIDMKCHNNEHTSNSSSTISKVSLSRQECSSMETFPKKWTWNLRRMLITQPVFVSLWTAEWHFSPKPLQLTHTEKLPLRADPHRNPKNGLSRTSDLQLTKTLLMQAGDTHQDYSVLCK